MKSPVRKWNVPVTYRCLRHWKKQTPPAPPSLISWGPSFRLLWTGFHHSQNSYSRFPWTTCENSICSISHQFGDLATRNPQYLVLLHPLNFFTHTLQFKWTYLHSTTTFVPYMPKTKSSQWSHKMLYSPIYNEVLIWRLLVTDWAHPGRLFLIHLDIKRSIKALKVRACDGSAWDRQPHLAQLSHKTDKNNVTAPHCFTRCTIYFHNNQILWDATQQKITSSEFSTNLLICWSDTTWPTTFIQAFYWN